MATPLLFAPTGGVNIRASLKIAFFNTKAARNMLDRATHRAFRYFGGYVRKVAQNSIRTRSRASRIGEPPTNRSGILKRSILFALDTLSRSVVVGPNKIKPGEAPHALEYGGTVLYSARIPKWKRQGNRKTFWMGARPYMQPAFDAGIKNLPGMWRKAEAST
jgi:hypothetical protein